MSHPWSPTVLVSTLADVSTETSIRHNTRIWAFSSVAAGAMIGERCTIGQGVHIGPKVVVGNGCKIQNGAQLFEGVTLEDDVFIGPHVVFTNVTIPRAFVNRKAEFKPTLVKKGASIGANATIVCGITIGEYAMVGAGSVVTKSVPAHALVTGNPARFTRWVCRCGNKLQQTHWAKIEPDGASSARYGCVSCTASYLSAGGILHDVEGPADATAP